MGLAGVEILCTVPLASYSIYLNATVEPVIPYQSWAFAHAHFATIVQVPAVVWQASPLSIASTELTRWFTIFCALVFFAFFGFADEARKNYRLAYVSVAKRAGLSTGAISATGTWTANGYVSFLISPSPPILRIFLFDSTNDMSYNSQSATMPVFITHQTEKKRDSLASFSSRISLPDYGGALADVQKLPFSPTATSAGSMSKESLPRTPVDMDAIPLPTLPEATLDRSLPPRYAPNVPHAV